MGQEMTCRLPNDQNQYTDWANKQDVPALLKKYPAHEDVLVVDPTYKGEGDDPNRVAIYHCDRITIDGKKGLPAKGSAFPITDIADGTGVTTSGSFAGTVVDSRPAPEPRSALNTGLRRMGHRTVEGAKDFVNIPESDSPGCHVGALVGLAATVGGLSVGAIAPKVLGEATRAGGLKLGAAIGLTGLALGLGAGLVYDISGAVFEIGHATRARLKGIPR